MKSSTCGFLCVNTIYMYIYESEMRFTYIYIYTRECECYMYIYIYENVNAWFVWLYLSQFNDEVLDVWFFAEVPESLGWWEDLGLGLNQESNRLLYTVQHQINCHRQKYPRICHRRIRLISSNIFYVVINMAVHIYRRWKSVYIKYCAYTYAKTRKHKRNKATWSPEISCQQVQKLTLPSPSPPLPLPSYLANRKVISGPWLPNLL